MRASKHYITTPRWFADWLDAKSVGDEIGAEQGILDSPDAGPVARRQAAARLEFYGTNPPRYAANAFSKGIREVLAGNKLHTDIAAEQAEREDATQRLTNIGSGSIDG